MKHAEAQAAVATSPALKGLGIRSWRQRSTMLLSAKVVSYAFTHSVAFLWSCRATCPTQFMSLSRIPTNNFLRTESKTRDMSAATFFPLPVGLTITLRTRLPDVEISRK
jgi:hypothetical protein